MKISFVVAMARNNVIGKDNELPWRLSADLQHFKAITLGKPVVMGRKTYESIGKPLPGRTNIIVTRDQNYAADACVIVHSMDAALVAAGTVDEVMVIGGAELYRQLLPRADRVYLTLVQAEVEGDASFPALDTAEWKELERHDHMADEKNQFPYSFLLLERRV